MKKRYALGVVFVVGAATGVAALMAVTGRPAVPTAVANAAEPGKGDAPANPGGELGWNGFDTQYEATKWRTVIDKVAGTYNGGEKTQYKQVPGEYEIQIWAARSRGGGNTAHLVWMRKRWVKAEGVDKLDEVSPGHALLASDAARIILFIERMKDAKKSKDEVVDRAWAEVGASLRTVYGGPSSSGIKLSASYNSKFTYTWTGDGLWEGSNTDLNKYFEQNPTDLVKVLSEGLKDLEQLKKAEWSPVP